jgi:hypothetical protein
MHTSKNGREKEYAAVVEAVAPVLTGFSHKLIAIGGLPLSGKTTLGRYLAWWFNASLIETDLFRDPGKPKLLHKNDQAAAIIEYRRNLDCPVIIEGATVLRLLSQLGLRPDLYIHVNNEKIREALAFKADIESYYREFLPHEHADFTLMLDHDR